LAQILEEPYPKINRKRKAGAAEMDRKSSATDYSSLERPVVQPAIKNISYEILMSKFPQIPANFIKSSLTQHRNLYAPTFIFLHGLPQNAYTPIRTMRTPRSTLKGDLEVLLARNPDFAEELGWVEAWVEGKQVEEERKRRKLQEDQDAEAARELNYQEHESGGGLLEWYEIPYDIH
jgi:hypothetical protein